MDTEKIQVTCVFVQDPSNGYTAFFSQLPNIIAEGDTQEEATKNLIETVKVVFKHQNEAELQNKYASNPNITTKPFNINLAAFA